ncbi:MAG: beta-galactosidase [Patescibacteria group bacterium]
MIFKKIFKTLLVIFSSLCVLAVILLAYFNLPVKNNENKAKLGVTFSSRYAQDIGLDWKEAYIAVLDDIGAKKVRIPVYWDLSEPEEGKYDFSDIDWQLAEAEKRNAEIILVIGQKVPRWPECFIPEWAGISDEKRKGSLIKFVSAAAEHFKNYPAVKFWQIENEPFLNFGVCPEKDYNLVDEEIYALRKIDNSRKVIITDSGELSFWISAAKRADVFGTTMYRDVVSKKLGTIKYPIGPNFFKFKRFIIHLFANQDNVAVVELQGEPWMDGWTINFPLENQLESMNEEKLKDNVQFAKNTGISDIYLWGAEWWYYLKVEKNYPNVWEEAKNIFEKNN